jgi:hypothetical protein
VSQCQFLHRRRRTVEAKTIERADDSVTCGGINHRNKTEVSAWLQGHRSELIFLDPGPLKSTKQRFVRIISAVFRITTYRRTPSTHLIRGR